MHNDFNIDNLIAKKLAGEATSGELMVIEEWLQSSNDNRFYYDSLVRLHGAAGSAPMLQVDTDQAYLKVLQRIHSLEINRNNKGQRGQVLGSWIRIAAILVAVTGLGYFAYRLLWQDVVATERFEVVNETKEATLSDSTTIFMNRNTTLTFTYSNKRRKAVLAGEAYLELASDPTRPFEIHAGGLVIHDIGTALNVHAPSGHDTVKVVVIDGEVIVVSGSNKSVTLRKGDEAAYIKSSDAFILSTMADTNTLSYKTRIFVFDNATLENVASKLADVYGIHFRFEGDISLCRITATFRDEKIESVMDVIAETLNLDVVKVENGFVLSGNNCGE